MKNLEDEVGMVNEDERRKKTKKKNVEKNGDYDEFLDDLEADPDLRKEVKIYEDENFKKARKHLNREELDDILGNIQLCELFEDL